MKALIQRVSNAKVEIEGKITSEINQGILVFLGIEKADEKPQVDKMIKKLLAYRVFYDSQEKMNLSLTDINGGMLLVSQFTLAADTKSGTRAGFSSAKSPAPAKDLYDYFLTQIKQVHSPIASGIFGADMQVSLTNDGPVTFLLEC
ncbi:D-aminoacyl-tRNA deacylase (EC 3.1.1.96) [uncultured Gammaproteobacteria bacterium]|uniref:D-aminoacyl-tRNA deacylase n=1 Tax=Bathymodiolus heckerae thiotrophic gill symbiont TaxID=1052212 RepID=UPI0010B20B08|nr:D-aminoacyl-tRNA deacylase [Bathymodiolus heckerae thiotrophic gill symbiont]CAC9441230.1 D-aminoacyl-tRNA deacylase (EC 3.1.1.96) [uncultured Gammaproteobacteria bacterium]SMN12771.1 D-tyrosyl-tRNA(Tyr) deacylase (EC 3.6.1.n1) [Bathymodiolus heckerae thiotrophic gill symbiont]SMN14462.1 D-tyrosyl-tRNA(Tyr) deacylase (EC 3.6.1.n1) [uncultured Candidatus Thioglobus sp.]